MPNALKELLSEFVAYLREDLCLAQATIGEYCRSLGPFLASIKQYASRSKLRTLQTRMIHDYVIEASKDRGRAFQKKLCSSIRMFLRFVYIRGYLKKDLVQAVPSITVYKYAGLPKGLPWESVEKLLLQPDRSTHSGRRTYAVLQLIANYGVRIGQVLSLRLRDIDWKKGTIYFRPYKRGKALSFPLKASVAEALLDYIKKDRQNASFKEVVLTVNGKSRPAATVVSAVKHCYKKAGIKIPFGVTHPIRHAFATKLVREGVPFKTVSDLLGHRSMDTTFIYTKVNIPQLRLLARPWPKEVSS